MKHVLPVLVIGLQVGAIYSLVGLGIALVYKATGVLNFAQGELGTVPAFVAYTLMVGGNLAEGQPDKSRLWWAAIVAILSGAALAVFIYTVIVRRLASSSPVTSLVATAGVALALVQLQLIVFEARGRAFPRPLAGAPCLGAVQDGRCTSPLTIGGVIVPWHTIVVVAVLFGAAALLALFFKTPAGVALLATAQEPFAASLQGISVRGMATLAWGAAGALAGLAGILGAGVFENLSPGLTTTTFLIPAFTGAVLGGMTSMVGAVIGGLVLGITVAAANEIVFTNQLSSSIPGPPQVATLLVLLLVLLFRPRGLFGKDA